jgi:catechol-2,3-dioxygenase
VVCTQDFGFPFFAVTIIGVQCAVTTACVAAEFLFPRFGFSVTGQVAASATWASMGFYYHALHFTQNSYSSTTTACFNILNGDKQFFANIPLGIAF